MINKYTKNATKEEASKSKYRLVDEFKFSNVSFRSATVKNSTHKNTVAFIIDDSKTGERLICLEFNLKEALIVIGLLTEAMRIGEK